MRKNSKQLISVLLFSIISFSFVFVNSSLAADATISEDTGVRYTSSLVNNPFCRTNGSSFTYQANNVWQNDQNQKTTDFDTVINGCGYSSSQISDLVAAQKTFDDNQAAIQAGKNSGTAPVLTPIQGTQVAPKSIPAVGPSNYVPLVQIPGLEFGNSGSDGLGTFLPKLFDFGIAACVALAVVMIIFGGIELMTTDSWSGKSDGKNKITNAIEGLAIAFLSWLLLFTINPQLVKFTDNQLLQKGPVPQTSTNIAPSVGALTDQAARDQLTSAGIPIISSGDCNDINNAKCTSFEGLPQKAVDGLINAEKWCTDNYTGGCIRITAGTEIGHKSHGVGIATVDIEYDAEAEQALQLEGVNKSDNFGGVDTRGIYTCEPNGGGSEAIACSSDGASVMHVQF